MSFLMHRLDKNYSYSAINTAKSALSLLGNMTERDTILLKHFMRGAFNKNPPPPPLYQCYAENAICYIDDVITTVKGFQGRSRSIANIIKAVLSAQVCARGRDWLESVSLLLSVSERDRVDFMALGGAKISIM